MILKDTTVQVHCSFRASYAVAERSIPLTEKSVNCQWIRSYSIGSMHPFLDSLANRKVSSSYWAGIKRIPRTSPVYLMCHLLLIWLACPPGQRSLIFTTPYRRKPYLFFLAYWQPGAFSLFVSRFRRSRLFLSQSYTSYRIITICNVSQEIIEQDLKNLL